MSSKKGILLIGLCIFIIGMLSLGSASASERILRVCLGNTCFIDPAVGSDLPASMAQVNIFDPLVFPDTKGISQPHVAESWEVSADAKDWTFHLRPGIKFHDGTELTAEDVKFSMDRLKTIGGGYAYLFEEVSSVELIDNYTVVFHLEKSFGPFLSTLSKFFILNKDEVMTNIEKPGSYGDMGDYGKKYLQTHDASSGPYMIKEFVFDEYLLLVKNPDYFLPFDPDCPDEIKMYLLLEKVTVRTMMSNRELDISDDDETYEALKALDKIEGIDLAESYSAGGAWGLSMNTKKPPTDDIHFRKAMAWAMDYQVMVNSIFPDTIQSRGDVSHMIPGFDPTVFQYHRDLDKAREELKQSKYYDQLDKYPVTLHYCAEYLAEGNIALLFQSNMVDIGIKANIVATPWMLMVDEMSTLETSPNIECFYAPPTYPEAGSVLKARYSSSTASSSEQNEWLLDANYDAMIADALSTTNQEERFAKYSKLQHYIVDLCPTIFLSDLLARNAYQAGYVDWPQARGEGIPIFGYAEVGRFIKVYPEKREELLKQK